MASDFALQQIRPVYRNEITELAFNQIINK